MLGRPLSRRDALGAALSGAALLGFAPEAFADMAKTEAELTEADRMAAKIREKDATFIQPGKNRNNIKVPKAIRKLKAPKITFPASTADLEDYTLTPSGLYVQELVVGDEAGESPSSGKVLEIHYIGSVCLAESDGTYDCAVKSGPADIYPNLPQGILQNSPSFDSSYGRGRTMKVRYQRAQLSQGLEEALSTMKPGGSRMVFLTPALSFACPKGRQCVADIEIDQRMAFYIKLVSVGEKTDVGA